MIIAQISDTHIKRKGRLLHHMIDTARYLKRAVRRLNGLDPRPQVVLATGDLVESGKPKEYKRLRKLLDELEIPLYVIPGNHDDRERFREAFSDHRYLPGTGRYVQYVIEDYPVRLIGLDSLREGRSGGELDPLRLYWLDTRLAEQPSRPTVVFLHHPPFRTGIRSVDALGFRGVEEFAGVIRRHPQVLRVVAGHIHRPLQVPWAGTYASTAPSTAHQIVLELRERRPLGFVLEPPGFALHVWQPQSGLVSYACFTDAPGSVIDYPGCGDLRARGGAEYPPGITTFVAVDRAAS
jgi:Icc protein